MREMIKALGIKITELSTYLGFSRPTLYKYMEEYDLMKYGNIDYKVKTVFDYIIRENPTSKMEVLYFIMNWDKDNLIKELTFQNEEKEKRAAELVVVNNELKIEKELVRNSKTLLHASLESFKDIVIWSVDKNYCYLYFNEAFKKAMKLLYNEDVEIGRNLLNYINIIDDRDKAKRNHDLALSGQSHTVLEEYGDEYILYYESSFNPIYNDDKIIIGATGFSRDVTERIVAEREIENELNQKEELKNILLTSEKRYRELVHNLDAGVIVHAADTSIIMNNEKACELLGLSDDMIKGKKAIDPTWKFVRENLEPLPLEEYPVNLVLSSGEQIRNIILGVYNPVFSEIVWVSVNGTPYIDDQGKIEEVIISFFNITEMIKKQTRLSETFDLLDETQKIANVGTWELDLKTNLIWASQEAFNIYDLPRESEYIDLEKTQNLIVSEDKDIITQGLLNLIKNGDPYDVYFRINTTTKLKHIHSNAHLIKNSLGEPIKVLGFVRDVTELKQKEAALIHMSYHDPLTGLYNRRFFQEQLKRLDNPRNLPLSIIMGDVNGLKLTNDAFGHLAGDKLLKMIGDIISTSIRGNDIASRWGGDEFAILVPSTGAAATEKLISRIHYKIKKASFEYGVVSVSFGSNTKTEEHEDISEIFTSAEVSMYQNKLVEIHSIRGQTINTIMTTLFEKSVAIKEHSTRVSELSVSIAKKLGFSKTNSNDIKTMGLIHDIGKIVIDLHILDKPGKLTDEERKIIEQHSLSGSRMLNSSHEYARLAAGVLHHHERIDGKGYPNGIKGDQIPIESKIIAVADAFDAMTAKRPYRLNPLSSEEAIAELQKYSGTQFDKEVVDVLVNQVLKSKDL